MKLHDRLMGLTSSLGTHFMYRKHNDLYKISDINTILEQTLFQVYAHIYMCITCIHGHICRRDTSDMGSGILDMFLPGSHINPSPMS
jgi:hypothetical protein